MSPRKKPIYHMQMNDREISFPEGASVLRAAELNNVYIPSLCAHKDLSPFGGCRMCIVEIEGMRGYPLACSTVAAEGMKVQTDTPGLKETRAGILQLILSEHPSSCLLCGERAECKQNQYTIRKAGVTTGCRSCPKDHQCELQDVVEEVGLTDFEYPIHYLGYEVEHDDPFFDRDYNLCILCGRCVRMCQEVRGTDVLAFNFRGSRTRIGTAYLKSHIEAGCEFCGSCVAVCPTGALSDKCSKWDGKPDGFEVSTCPFCAIGCQVELGHKNGQLSQVLAHLDPEINDGQLCVRGRYAMPETTHHYERAKKPMLRRGEYFREMTWTETIGEVTEKLKDIPAEDFLMVVSGDLSNESLYTAQKFVRLCLNSNSIDSTARYSLPGGLGLWAKLFSFPISITGVQDADTILAVGLDSRFYFSIAGTEIRRAQKEGAKLVTIDPRDSNLARYTDYWLRPTPGKEGLLLKAIAQGLEHEKSSFTDVAKEAAVDNELLKEAVKILSSGENLALVLGPTVFEYQANEDLVDALLKLASRKNTIFMPLYNGANTRGALELGAIHELLPGVAQANGNGISLDKLLKGKAKPKVIYLVGEVPFMERPDCEYLICQDLYYPPFEVDAFLPAASFAEAEGTLTNMEGRVQEFVRIENLPDSAVNGFVRPDWAIFGELARKLGSFELQYKDSGAVLKEISSTVSGFPAKADREPRRLEPTDQLPVETRKNGNMGQGSFILVAEPAGFRHRGIDLSSKVEGLKELALEEGFQLHPEDLEQLEIKPGENIRVTIEELHVTGPVKSDAECPRGAIYFVRVDTFGGLEHRANFAPLYRLGKNPVNVKVKAAR